MIGQTISHYQILEKLGEGGMGVVYKAQDLQLRRTVALKFLPPHLSSSEQDKARFMQEAQAASALNHPNVCTIHDIQLHDGQMFIVMEYVDGQTLRDRHGSVSFKQAIDIGVQVAEGLAAAHDKGIVHRDIKPENIMLRKDGIAQIMDFGLAKLRGTVSRLTKEGSTVGTAGYMSPEQIQGHDADHRSDIFSLGVVLYELLTGQLPFRGIHETALAYEIVNVDPPPMSSIRTDIDPSLDAIVLECLEKDPNERTQSAKQVAIDLKRFRRESSRSRVSRISAARPVARPDIADGELARPATEAVRFRWLPWIVAGTCVVAAAASLTLYFRTPQAREPHPVRFTVAPPVRGSIENQVPIFSPDGQRIAYVARDSAGMSMLWVRALRTLHAEPLPGTSESTFPFWSPDSRFLGYFQNGKLKKIDVSGGPGQTLADAPDARGGTWGSSGTIVFSPRVSGPLFKVSDAGGAATELTALDTARQEDSHRWPCFLPDGRHYIYLRRSSEDEKTGIYYGSLDSKDFTMLVPAKVNAAYAVPGYLLFVRESALMAQPFDPAAGTLSGSAYPIAEEIGIEPSFSMGLFSCSATGDFAYLTGSGSSGRWQFEWLDRAGKVLEKAGTPGSVLDFALSPDEKRVVFRRVDPQTRNHDLWILDLVRRTESRFTFSPARDDDPVWSPDGSRIGFDTYLEGVPNLFQKQANGSGSEEVLLKSPARSFMLDWSGDGKYVLFVSEGISTGLDIWALPLGGDRKPFPVVATKAVEEVARISPDGRWLAYSSDESGKLEVYVQAFPVSSGKWQLSTDGGGAPVWSKDGKEVFYLAPDKRLMAVSVKSSGTSLEQGIPRPLFYTHVDDYAAPNRYAVSRDGKRFLVNNATGGDSSRSIAVVLNWLAEAPRQ